MEHDKLGFYLDVARTVQKLKQVGRKTLIDTEDDDSLMTMLWRLQNLLKETSDDSRRAGLRPFPRLCGLQQDLLNLYRELEAGLEGAETNPAGAILGRIRHRALQDLLGRFEQVFREEVEERLVFISPARPGLLEFSSSDTFLHDAIEKQYFQYLPQIAQSNFEDAGRCLVYGLPGAAISMSLQAVEATIRFFYIRHGGPNDKRRSTELPDWANMINWRPDNQLPFLPGDEVGQRHCHAMLDRLRHRYRNAIAHGRAYFEAGKPDASTNEAELVFRDCWAAVRLLAAETQRRPQLNLHIEVSDRLDFDTAVATYLYSWNPELPPFGIQQIDFDSSLSPGELVDTTVVYTDFWPNRIHAQDGDALSGRVRACFRMQPNYSATIDPLIGFVDKCRRGVFTSRFKTGTPREDDVSLSDLFAGIKHHVHNDSQQILTETWKMLDKFVDSSLSPDGRSLVTDLNMRAAFKALCEPDDVSA